MKKKDEVREEGGVLVLDILRENGWALARIESGKTRADGHDRAWVVKDGQEMLLKDAWHVYMVSQGMPLEMTTHYEVEAYEPTEDEIEQLKLQGLY